MKIYLDNCYFNRPYDSQTAQRIKLETEAKLSIQMQVINSQLELVWSFMLDYENAANPYADQREAIAEWKNLAKKHIQATQNILEHGKQIEAITAIKSKDALHLACAIEAECHYIITTDRLFLKKAQSIDVIDTLNPIDFVLKLENSP